MNQVQPTAVQSTPATNLPAAQAAKQEYQQPELRCYGNVADLTRGTGGTRRDTRFNTRKS